MSQPTPNIFLIDGEDDFSVAGFIASLEHRLGSADMAGVNTTHLDGRNLDLDELKRACFAMPFIAEYRLVIIEQPVTRLNDNTIREKFKKLLQTVPPTTLVALVHHENLTEERDRKRNRLHWLESWFLKTGGNLAFKHFDLPRGQEMVKWTQNRVKAAGGEFTPAALAKLAMLVGEAPRRANQEIVKLLEYVNYARPVEVDDVEKLTPNSAEIGDFALVNALRSQNTRQAQAILHKLLEDNEPIWLFASIVSQFRRLILVRELMDQRATKDEIVHRLDLHPYVVEQAMEHARHYSITSLEAIYQLLHELDLAIKTGQMDSELALDMLMIELTTKPTLTDMKY